MVHSRILSKSMLPDPMLLNSASRLMWGIIRSLSTSSSLCGANHYDILGITPKATQGDIKSAYYKLSKVYHPDKSNNDEEAAKKFRAISEAYEVLGNVQLKKMYDKGLLGGRVTRSRVEYNPDPEPTDPTLKFYKSRTHRKVVPTMDGRQPIYDFDTWSKSHYGDIFQKTKYDKEFLRKTRAKKMDAEKSNRQESLIYVMLGLGSLFLLLVSQGTTDYDLDKTAQKYNKSDTNSKD